MKRVLLTGGTGFIGGQAFAPLALRGYSVSALKRPGSAPPTVEPDVAVEWIDCDLKDPAAARSAVAEARATHLLHFAWNVTPGSYLADPDNLDWVRASLDLLRAFAAAGGRRVVMAGTCFEYDLGHNYLIESVTPCVPDTLYGVCKHSLRQMLMAAARELDLSAAWGRIFYLYGPREYRRRLVAAVINTLLAGDRAKATSGEELRDFMDARDVASAFVALLDSETQDAVNICSGAITPLRRIVQAIADELGRPDAVDWGAYPARPNEPRLIAGDPTRLFEEVGWRPEISLEQGLRDAIDWWKANPDGR